jgi:hypothetical protein
MFLLRYFPASILSTTMDKQSEKAVFSSQALEHVKSALPALLKQIETGECYQNVVPFALCSVVNDSPPPSFERWPHQNEGDASCNSKQFQGNRD